MTSRDTGEVPEGQRALSSRRHVGFTSWEGDLALTPSDPVTYADPHVAGAGPVTYEGRTWVSPVVESPFPATELIPSWNARTPGGSWLSVEARVRSGAQWSPWFVMARWCEHDPDDGGAITRTTVADQSTDAARVAADTVVATDGHPFDAWQLRLVAAGDAAGSWPTISLAGAAACAVDPATSASAPGGTRGRELEVRPLSQRRHVDTFPHWDNGGQSWCSATSTAMLLDYWGVGPCAGETAWVGHDIDPEVVHAVRQVFDRDYGGAGNWAFNTAYAASRGLRAHVTRLRDLTEAEAFIASGIPLVVSVTFTRDQLDGAGYDTGGHLLTIVGFTPGGDVICNDPNSHELPSNAEVRVVFAREQFERVWAGPRGGVAYVMHPPGQGLPPAPREANW